MDLLKQMTSNRVSRGLDPEPPTHQLSRQPMKLTKKGIAEEKPKKTMSLKQRRQKIIDEKSKIKDVLEYFEKVVEKHCVESSSDDDDDEE